MIKFENTDVYGWESAIRGMRNPKNSWEKSDSKWITHTIKSEEKASGVYFGNWEECKPYFSIGENDYNLMLKLNKGGSVHAKYRRMINVTVDITAPLYWWKEFDTYKVGTVANSCSTMHKIHDKEFVLDDFSHEHLIADQPVPCKIISPITALQVNIDILNQYRELFNKTGEKKYWWQMIQLLPSSYNQKRTVQLNYEVLNNIYKFRKDHKLDEWRYFCNWIDFLPHSRLIIE